MRRILLASLASVLAFAGGGGTVMVKGRPFLAEVAVTVAERSRGLMYRQGLAKDRCMVFLGDAEGPQPVHTRNHLIALDVAWLDADGTVVEIAEHLRPQRPGAEGPAHEGTALSRHYVGRRRAACVASGSGRAIASAGTSSWTTAP